MIRATDLPVIPVLPVFLEESIPPTRFREGVVKAGP
jgi:hypothetical protein